MFLLSNDKRLSFPSLSKAYPYIETPSMVVGSATDSFPLNNCGQTVANHDEAYVQSWREEVIATARSISQAKPSWGVYMENCPFHTTIGNENIYFGHTVPVDDGSGDMSLKDLLNNFQKEVSPKVGIDRTDRINPNCKFGG